MTNTPPGLEQQADLLEEGALAIVLEMMNGKSRDDRIHSALTRKWLCEIVLAQLDQRVIGKAPSRAVEHRAREVDPKRACVWMTFAHERDQSTIARPKVDETLETLGQGIEQHRLGDSPMRDLAR